MSIMVSIIIAGGRDFSDYELLKSEIDKLLAYDSNKTPGLIEIVSGGAKGADTLGERYANERNLSLKVFPADWNKYGKSAGYRRNAQMADYADELIAFWDGKSLGTKHMIDTAMKNNAKVYVISY